MIFMLVWYDTLFPRYVQTRGIGNSVNDGENQIESELIGDPIDLLAEIVLG